MPNKKSAIQMVRVQERNRARNRPIIRRVRTLVRNAKMVLSSGDSSTVVDAVKTAQRELDKAVQKGILHRRNAARRKSRLMRKLAAALRA